MLYDDDDRFVVHGIHMAKQKGFHLFGFSVKFAYIPVELSYLVELRTCSKMVQWLTQPTATPKVLVSIPG
jgi:hypothetical protein